jgi:hypothetical protein
MILKKNCLDQTKSNEIKFNQIEAYQVQCNQIQRNRNRINHTLVIREITKDAEWISMQENPIILNQRPSHVHIILWMKDRSADATP